MDLRPYRNVSNEFEHLSLRDLLEAREQYHLHLMRHANVVATAVGRYLIRKDDGWPEPSGRTPHKHDYPRTLENSEVRPYSWPCVLVVVDKWADATEFSKEYDPDQFIPKTLYLPDGRRIPVCVVLAPRDLASPPPPETLRYPTNNIGGGFPITVNVQGQERAATIACLVTDGHLVYGLTNRHVTGEPGEQLCSQLGGRSIQIGRTAPGQLTRDLFTAVYPGLAGESIYVNLDAGLIDIDDLGAWTAQVREVGTVGPLADLGSDNLSLALVGCAVQGCGAGSGLMKGEVKALFYRYKSLGGFEYVADLVIGATPRSDKEAGEKHAHLFTRQGDSGTLWLLEPQTPNHSKTARKSAGDTAGYAPLAMQWGAHVLNADGVHGQSFALATLMSTICSRLNVDVVRDWNLDQPDTWGAVGHFSIASSVAANLSNRVPRLSKLMSANAHIISPPTDTISSQDFTGMGTADFVPLADVPDFFWKHGKQGAARPGEGPNHFADMDQQRPSDKLDLLTLCKTPANIDPTFWDKFYDQVVDPLTGAAITYQHRGLLPFRVWQIFDEMVSFAGGDLEEFLCAAGVLTHYVGDACQPLHISCLFDGDPFDAVSKTVRHKDGTQTTTPQARGAGVHSTYEDVMVGANRAQILKALAKSTPVQSGELVKNGREAAALTVDLMKTTFAKVPPRDIVNTFISAPGSKTQKAKALWTAFGPQTIECMKAGTYLLAVLWESAWTAGDGEKGTGAVPTLSQARAMDVCRPANFLTSYTIDQIGAHLSTD
jgi:hypothetical protein